MDMLWKSDSVVFKCRIQYCINSNDIYIYMFHRFNFNTTLKNMDVPLFQY